MYKWFARHNAVILTSTFVIVVIFFGYSVATALNTWNTGFQLNNNAGIRTMPYGNAAGTAQAGTRTAINTSGKNLFVGTKTTGELNSFCNNGPAGTACNVRNLALNRYVHNNTYNYPSVNTGVCPPGLWDGLTDGSTARCTGIWASSAHGGSNNYVSIDLGATRTAFRITLINAPSAVLDAGEASNMTKTVRIQTKTATPCSANSGGWTTRATATNLATGATYHANLASGLSVRCVRLWQTDHGDSWRHLTHGGGSFVHSDYSFLAELQVWGI